MLFFININVNDTTIVNTFSDLSTIDMYFGRLPRRLGKDYGPGSIYMDRYLY